MTEKDVTQMLDEFVNALIANGNSSDVVARALQSVTENCLQAARAEKQKEWSN